MTTPTQRLQDALDSLDAVFAPLFAQPITVGGCTYCYTTSDLEALTGPADHVSEDLIRSVAGEVPDHWTEFPALYRRLAPRIVRLLATGQLHVNGDCVASRLLAAGWRDWPKPQREALEEVWNAWWRATLHEYPAAVPAVEVLETISVSTDTLTPWLDIWAETCNESADKHLSDALDDWLLQDRLADLRLGFHDELHATPQLLPWLLSLAEGRIGAAQLYEVERIAYS